MDYNHNELQITMDYKLQWLQITMDYNGWLARAGQEWLPFASDLTMELSPSPNSPSVPDVTFSSMSPPNDYNPHQPIAQMPLLAIAQHFMAAEMLGELGRAFIVRGGSSS